MIFETACELFYFKIGDKPDSIASAGTSSSSSKYANELFYFDGAYIRLFSNPVYGLAQTNNNKVTLKLLDNLPNHYWARSNPYSPNQIIDLPINAASINNTNPIQGCDFVENTQL